MDDDDRKQREKPSEIAQIASAFLEPEDLERMGVAEKDAQESQCEKDAVVEGFPNSSAPGTPRPQDLPSQPHASDAQLVTDDAPADDEHKNASPPSPGDDASNASSCSKR